MSAVIDFPKLLPKAACNYKLYANIDTSNVFNYCSNTPITCKDINGESSTSVLTAMADEGLFYSGHRHLIRDLDTLCRLENTEITHTKSSGRCDDYIVAGEKSTMDSLPNHPTYGVDEDIDIIIGYLTGSCGYTQFDYEDFDNYEDKPGGHVIALRFSTKYVIDSGIKKLVNPDYHYLRYDKGQWSGKLGSSSVVLKYAPNQSIYNIHWDSVSLNNSNNIFYHDHYDSDIYFFWVPD